VSLPTSSGNTLASVGDGSDALRKSLWTSFVALLASSGTLVCCALPALLVALGAGAVLSSLVAAVPQLVWISEHKLLVFSLAAVMLTMAGALQWSNRNAPCPVDPALAAACTRTRRMSRNVYLASVGLFAIGGWFAFIAPWLNSR
jgi:hypothetical protein